MNERERLRVLKAKTVEDLALRVDSYEGGEKGLSARELEGGAYSELIAQAGFGFAPLLWLKILVVASFLLALFLYHLLGYLAAFSLTAVFAYYFAFTFLRARAERRRRKAVAQLSGFIDSLQVSLRNGSGVEQAFKESVLSLPPGVLREEAFAVLRIVQAGVSLRSALRILPRKIAGHEMVTTVTTLMLYSSTGGKVVAPLERLGRSIRMQQSALERAARDLVGVSQAFYLILSLSFAVPASMFAFDPNYIWQGLRHPILTVVIQTAVVAQILSLFAFRRLASLRL